ncbi:MAG: GGDEF domain-containing protein [Devosia sp.]|uniref:GGDEF domain-containing protein n=1 Tax=Devosia sp. TaxID=1871048 RepID=UPI001ACCF004|nr:GGDEF domain-containing protein [Devosia sp.]MBN9317846.1 GGDEF domain-containing protein [Devosia sp.]
MEKSVLPPSEWSVVWRRTILIAAASTVASWLVSNLVMMSLQQGMNDVGTILALTLPAALGGPVLLFLQVRSAQLRVANRRLETLASTDWLTDCLNRRVFTASVSSALDSGEPTGTLLVIDADHFKTINDRFGHERGDEVLQMIAAAIRDSIRDGDLVGRLGGEEFGVFLKGAGFEAAGRIAERIRAAINGLFVTSEGVVQRLSVSIGGAVCAGDGGFAQLFRVADRRLYAAKHAGRNRVELGGSIDDSDVAALVAAIG